MTISATGWLPIIATTLGGGVVGAVVTTFGSQAATEAGSDPAVRLQKLQEVLDTGFLTQDEYETKRAEIINSI